MKNAFASCRVLALVATTLAACAGGEEPIIEGPRTDSGAAPDDRGSFGPVDSIVPMMMEMEVEPDEPETMNRDGGSAIDSAVEIDTGVRPLDASMTPADSSASTAGRCVHSFGGIYVNGGCSAGYQCVRGSWVMRDASTLCVCIEATGMVGCGVAPGTDAGTDTGAARDAGAVVDVGVRDSGVMPPRRTSSESVNAPTSGRLERAARSAMTPSFVLANTGRNAYFGTEETVFWLTTGFAQVRARHPSAQLPQLRDISVQNGGVPTGAWPHSSHQSGRDADGTYYLRSCSATSGCPLADAPLDQFDAAATWTLFETWIRAGVAMYIFVDHALQRPLYEEARRRGATAAELSRWIQYPRASTFREGVVRHIDNHRNHFHVRFLCPADDSRCVQ